MNFISRMTHDSIEISPSESTLGAFVTGKRIAHYTSRDYETIKQAFLDFAVLIWPGQHLVQQEQTYFGSQFGKLVIEHLAFSNLDEDNKLREESHPLMKLFKGNEGWHTDSSFQMLAAKASILSAVKVPRTGGETEWADMRAAYADLNSEMKDRIQNLSAYHSLYRSQGKIGLDDEVTASGLATLHADDRNQKPGRYSSGYQQQGESPLRPLVKTHPETNRPALYIGRHAYSIPGMCDEDAIQLLSQLLDRACQPPRVLSHSWSVGDIVMWDNRCVLHRARPWPLDQARVMYHTRVNGEPSSESALNSVRVAAS